MKEGPPATIWGGRWLSGQFSILMIESLLQRASSKGRLCRLGLSFKYSSSRFSSVPVLKNKINYYYIFLNCYYFKSSTGMMLSWAWCILNIHFLLFSSLNFQALYNHGSQTLLHIHVICENEKKSWYWSHTLYQLNQNLFLYSWYLRLDFFGKIHILHLWKLSRAWHSCVFFQNSKSKFTI